MTVGPDGRTSPIELLPGRYTVTETAPPPGYDTAGPWDVEVTDADVLLEVNDPARRGSLRIEKVDAVTRHPIAGAAFNVAADRDSDPSTFETPVPDPFAPLLVGRYAVSEVTAPPGYRLLETPVVVEVLANAETVAVVENFPIEKPAEKPAKVEPVTTTTGLPPPAPPPPAPVTAPAEVPTPVTAAPVRPVVVAELPRTGAAHGRLAAAGLLLMAGGSLLAWPPGLRRGASSSGSRGRPAPRQRPRA